MAGTIRITKSIITLRRSVVHRLKNHVPPTPIKTPVDTTKDEKSLLGPANANYQLPYSSPTAVHSPTSLSHGFNVLQVND